MFNIYEKTSMIKLIDFLKEGSLDKNIASKLITVFQKKYGKYPKIKEIIEAWLSDGDNWKKAYYTSGENYKNEVLKPIEDKIRQWGKTSIFKNRPAFNSYNDISEGSEQIYTIEITAKNGKKTTSKVPASSPVELNGIVSALKKSKNAASVKVLKVEGSISENEDGPGSSKLSHMSLGMKTTRVVISGPDVVTNQEKILKLGQEMDPNFDAKFFPATGKIVGSMSQVKVQPLNLKLRDRKWKAEAEAKAQAQSLKKEGDSLDTKLDSIKTSDLHKWITGQRWTVGKVFPATKAKTREDKIAILKNDAFQKAFIAYHQQYFNSLKKQLEDLAKKDLPSRGINKDSSPDDIAEMKKALLQWYNREDYILKSIKSKGFEQFVVDDITNTKSKV
jgi:hypothetical protein